MMTKAIHYQGYLIFPLAFPFTSLRVTQFSKVSLKQVPSMNECSARTLNLWFYSDSSLLHFTIASP